MCFKICYILCVTKLMHFFRCFYCQFRHHIGNQKRLLKVVIFPISSLPFNKFSSSLLEISNVFMTYYFYFLVLSIYKKYVRNSEVVLKWFAWLEDWMWRCKQNEEKVILHEWKGKKTSWVFSYIKYSKFWSVSLEYFVEYKPLIK